MAAALRRICPGLFSSAVERTAVALRPCITPSRFKMCATYVSLALNNPLRALYLRPIWRFPEAQTLAEKLKSHHLIKGEGLIFPDNDCIAVAAEAFGGKSVASQTEHEREMALFMKSRPGFSSLPAPLRDRLTWQLNWAMRDNAHDVTKE